MKVLVVGGGAREHALAWKCMQSPLAERVYCAPGNGGTGGVARNVRIQPDDVASLQRFAVREKVGLVVLGPDAAVAAGVGDALRESGFPVFGPDRDPGRIESSKAFAKRLMRTAGIPTADFEVFTEAAPAKAWARERAGEVVVKADGLALGKGVLLCSSVEESDAAIEDMLVKRRFGAAGASIVVEEKLAGREASLFAISDGTVAVPLEPARDYKRAFDGDEGPNTGGMGAFSPVPEMTDKAVAECMDRIVQPAVAALRDDGFEYRGVLYVGLMLTADGPKVLEFNARFGDPEAQVILPRLQSDLLAVMLTAARGTLANLPQLKWSDDAAVAVVVASRGYPGDHQTGFPIDGLTQMPPGVLVFHGGTRYSPGEGLVTSGGRVMTVVGLGAGLEAARRKALDGVAQIRFPGIFHRSDIGADAVTTGAE